MKKLRIIFGLAVFFLLASACTPGKTPPDLRSKPADEWIISEGFDPSFAELDPGQEHTLKDIQTYLSDNLGPEVLAKAEHAKFVIAVGEGSEIYRILLKKGYDFLEKVEKAVGFHQIYRAKNPKGDQCYVIIRVNGVDRIVHIQSLLKLVGVKAGNVKTVGRIRRYKDDYLKTFRSLDYIPDLAIYGFCNTVLYSILSANEKENGAHLASYEEQRQKKKLAMTENTHDLSRVPMQVVQFTNGKRLWVFQNFYGDLAGEVFEALFEYGVKRVVQLGTAGALHSQFMVGQMLTPRYIFQDGQGKRPLNRIKPISGVEQRGTYMRVVSPNIETKTWANRYIDSGVDLIEIEFGYLADVLKGHPSAEASVVLVISDVLTGAKHQDMTEWSKNVLSQIPDFKNNLDAILGFSSPDDYRITEYRYLPLLADALLEK